MIFEYAGVSFVDLSDERSKGGDIIADPEEA